MGKVFYVSILLAIVTVTVCYSASGLDPPPKRNDKDHLKQSLNSPKISEELKNVFLETNKNLEDEQSNILIEFKSGNSKALREFKEDSNSGVIKATATRGEKISSLVQRLEDNALSSQKDVIDFLESHKFEYRALWAANEIYVKDADANLIIDIAEKFGTVARIRTVGKVGIPQRPEPPSKPDLSLLPSNDVPWNINQIKARCKDIKCLGEGIVIAIIDSGVIWTHQELKDNYRGGDYSWFDPVNGSEFPTFTDSHGTHVAGIAVGKSVGVAPKAQWIACLGFRINFDEEVYLKACGEFVLCPHRWNNTKERDCSKAPDIVNNSWLAGARELLTFPTDFYYGIVAAWNAAGIISTFSAGNNGPWCTTALPPSTYDISFAIGATDNKNNIAYFSSRGPVINGAVMGFKSEFEFERGPPFGLSEGTCQPRTCQPSRKEEGGNRYVCTLIKPDISAPGVNINSSYIDSDTSYVLDSGTSMSAPTVAGVLALVLCANNQTPGNRRLDVATAQNILKSTADISKIDLEFGNDIDDPTNFAKSTNLLCNVGFDNNCGTHPNNLYGAGEVDACEAVKKVKSGRF